jgi:hypothetical protein
MAVVRSLIGFFGKKNYSTLDDKLGLFLMASVHIQFVVGIVLYLISPIVKQALSDMGAAMKDPVLRLWSVEHITIMVLAVLLITMGRVLSKKASTDKLKFKRASIYYTIGLILIMYGIPWLAR